MAKVKQAYNPKTKAWVKYEKFSNGLTRILDVKQKKPHKKFRL